MKRTIRVWASLLVFTLMCGVVIAQQNIPALVQVGGVLKQHLSFLPSLLGDDPWTSKF